MKPSPFTGHFKFKLSSLIMLAALVFNTAAASALNEKAPGASLSLAAPPALLQFSAGGHILAFAAEGMYAASGSHALHVDFMGANKVQPQPDKPAGAAGQNEALSKVTYAGLWPGITLTYNASPGNIYTTTYSLDPGVDPKYIRLHYNAPLSFNRNGALSIAFDTGTMTESAPLAWQEINSRRVPVDVSFQINGQELSFSLSKYDSHYALTIDPSLIWNTFLGGSGDDLGTSIAVDGSGNLYVTGSSNATWGSPVRAYSGLKDAFAAKLNSSGSLLWSTFLGGSDDDEGLGIVVNASGNVYVTGNSLATWGSPVRVFGGYKDAFVAKLNSSGSLLWDTFLGGSGYDLGTSIAVDGSGNIYVTGSGDYTWGSPVRAYTSGRDTFAAKLNSSGALLWNTFLGGIGGDEGYSIVVDSNGNIYVAGFSTATWGSSPMRAYTGGNDIFAVKLDSSGVLTWNTFLGGSGTDREDGGNNIAVDGSGNVYVTGYSTTTWDCSPVSCTLRAFTTSNADAFVAKLGSSGNLTWISFLGGSGGDFGYGIVLDGNGNVYITGESETWSCTPIPCTIQAFGGDYDAFAAMLTSSGTLAWNTFMGGSGFERGYGIVVDSSRNVYVTGFGDAAWGSPLRGYGGGNQDAFVVKVNSLSPAIFTISGNAGVTGVTLSYTDGTPKTATADDYGNYSLTVPYIWSGIVTPSHACYTFGPVNHSYNNVTSDQTTQDYTPTIQPGCANINVTIGGNHQGTYGLPSAGSMRMNYAGLDSGPVQVANTNSIHIISAVRDAWAANGLTTSFAQLMGLPDSQLSDTYVFPAYNNVTLNEQLRIGNVDSVPTTVTVTIGGVLQGTYPLAADESMRVNYAGLDSGPVIVQGTTGVHIIAAERDAWAANGTTTSFVQLMGLPAGQLSDTYVFPAYNNVTLNEQLRIGNVDSVPTTVTVTIGGVLQGTYPLAANESMRVNYAGLDSGPVIVQGTSGVHIIAAERDAWAAVAPYNTTTSFAQLMGLPAGQLSDTYQFPAYNNVTLNEQLRIGNVDSVPTNVTVTIGGVLRGTYPLAPNGSVRVNYAGLDSGPVVVQGTSGVHIIAAIRDAWAANGVTTSFTQLMGLPAGQLSNTYVFPAYNNVTLNEQLRFGVP